MSMPCEPTFMCLGIQKSGTSWLYRMMAQHPQIAVSEPKEPHFFNRERNWARGLDWYRSLFRCDPQTRAVGEFTPDSLWIRREHRDEPGFEATPDVAARVAEHFPDVRFLVCLRDPVTRAVSSYYHHIGAARLSPNRRLRDVGDQWGILSFAYYADHLEHWFRFFPRDRFKIMIYETDLAPEHRLGTLRECFEHVGVDPDFAPERLEARYNARRSHYDYRLSRLPGRLQWACRNLVPDFVKGWSLWDIPVDEDELAHLRAHYAERNRALAELLGRELPWS